MSGKGAIAIAFGYGAGIWFVIAAIKRRLLLQQAQRWILTRGRIIESRVVTQNGGKTSDVLIRYEFLAGERIEGSTPRVSGEWFFNNKQQAAFAARYVPGTEAEVFYDPRNPRNNCLDRTDATGVIVMILLAIGGSALASLLVWLERKP